MISTTNWTIIASIVGIVLGGVGGILATIARMRQTGMQGGSQLIRDALALVKSLQEERETMRRDNAALDKQVIGLRAQITLLETHLRTLQMQIEALTATADEAKRLPRSRRREEKHEA